MAPANFLQKQLEDQRFLHGIDYVVKSSHGPKILSTSELAHLNRLLTGDSAGDKEPWRFERMSVKIPSGRTHHFNILSNPIVTAREIVGNAWQMAGNQEVVDAAYYLYSQLVLSHLFNDANRRTAVLATLWLVRSHGGTLNARELADFPIGDIREMGDQQVLAAKVQTLISFD